jgi:hypothetical protein
VIELFITVFDGNYRKVLSDKSWFLSYRNTLICKKTILVNDLSDLEDFGHRLRIALEKYPEIEIKYVEHYREQTKSKFNLDINHNTVGYYYTIQYFVALLLCQQPFLFNVSSDCEMFFESDFLSNSIEELGKDSKMLTTTLPWSKNLNVGLHEQNLDFPNQRLNGNSFYHSYGFSDQVFIGDVKKLKNLDFNVKRPGTEHFPAYGGESFEKRVAMSHRANQAYRGVYKKYYYLHDKKSIFFKFNFLSKKIIRKCLSLLRD